MIMVRAGSAVDDTIASLIPLIEKGDIIIDGGNSNYLDTNRRIKSLATKGIMFLGVGVSGGEEGALNGPSIMPGGTKDAWQHVKPIFQKIAARVDDGSPCCDFVGEEGSGHFVKMVHNGIEYGDMQLLAEAYSMLAGYLELTNDEIATVFEEWNRGDLESYLVEITSDIFRKKRLGDGKIRDRSYFGFRRTKRNRKMDGHQRVGNRISGHFDFRVGFFPNDFFAKRTSRSCQ